MKVAILEIQFEDNAVYFPSIHFYLKSYYKRFGKNYDKIIWKKFPFVKDPDVEFVDNFLKQEKIDILMCSVYTWNNDQMIKVIREVKKINPTVKIVFGGPHVMTLFDKQEYFKKHDFIDVAILGDGETAVMEYLDHLVDKGLNTNHNKKIMGVSYNSDDENSSYTPARCLQIDAVSPYLDLKEEFIDRNSELDVFCAENKFIKRIVVDSNRGCPYRCTFCDWGGNTHTKVVKRNAESLFKEITLLLDCKFDSLYFADANFGLYDRDVDIIDFIADYKSKYGYPKKDVGVCFAKTDKATERIMKIFWSGYKAGFWKHYRIDIQDFDTEVLDNIKRKNLSRDAMLGIKAQIEKEGIPVKTQFIIGLPGQNEEKILRTNIDLVELNLSSNSSVLLVSLPGSEMNDPEYKAKHKLQVSNLTIDDHNSVPIRALDMESFNELGDAKVPVMHPEKWQYQDYVTESYSFDKKHYTDMICMNKLMNIFEYNWWLKPLRAMHKKNKIEPYDFYNDVFENMEKFPTLYNCVQEGKSQILKWLSGESKFMKVNQYDDPRLQELGVAINFENYVMLSLVLNKEQFIQELNAYYSGRELPMEDLQTALSFIDLMQIDDGISYPHEKTVNIKGRSFSRVIDPALHIFHTHDRPYRSILLSTCYDLRQRLNVYSEYTSEDKKINVGDLTYFLEDFC